MTGIYQINSNFSFVVLRKRMYEFPATFFLLSGITDFNAAYNLTVDLRSYKTLIGSHSQSNATIGVLLRRPKVRSTSSMVFIALLYTTAVKWVYIGMGRTDGRISAALLNAPFLNAGIMLAQVEQQYYIACRPTFPTARTTLTDSHMDFSQSCDGKSIRSFLWTVHH